MKERDSSEQLQKVRVPTLIIDRIARTGVDTVFGITGSYVANLLDGFHGREDVRLICTQHEQAAAMAAEAYARLHDSNLGVTMVTSGPGGTNLITGIYGSWFDSIPTVHITGQVGTFDLRGDQKIRQLGFQEADLVSVMKEFTKMSAQARTPSEAVELTNQAIHTAQEGRPGPVHVDIPIDIQMASTSKVVSSEDKKEDKLYLPEAQRVSELMAKAERPILLVGNGVRLSGGYEEFRKLVEELDWPVIPTWAFSDCLPDSDPHKVGLVGVYGNRGANFAIQNADFILSIGARLDGRLTGNPKAFGREALKVVVDIDEGELDKGLADVKIQADAKGFMRDLIRVTRSSYQETWGQQEKQRGISLKEWKARCAEWKEKYPAVTEEHMRRADHINPYYFSRLLSDVLGEGQVIIPDCGGNLAHVMQAFKVKEGQRIFSTFGNSPMGYALPAAIGASFARPGEDIVCTIGDGGLQMNIQELQTLKNYNLPVKVFVYNNSGYGIIRQFQDSYMEGRHVASDGQLPDFVKVARAYGIPATRIRDQRFPDQILRDLRRIMRQPGPMLIDVMMDPEAKLEPKAEWGNPIEEASPPLSEKELLSNMIIPRWQR